ncbi:MAG: TonB-dependent receptor, partial [Verrucomicrobia bacterium]|nr:TonB-dependent receptor [Verrucomicrobiota bacterium]
SFVGATTGNLYTVKPGTTGANPGAGNFFVNGPTFNTYVPTDEQLAARERRYGGTVNLTYNPWDWLKLYDHFIIQRNEETSVTPNQGFSAGDKVAGLGSAPISIPAYNPYNPFGEALIPTGELMREFGPWKSDVIGRTFRNLAGGTIFFPWNNWFLDSSALYGESDVSQSYANAIKVRQLQEAFDGALPQLPGVFFDPFIDENTGGHPNAAFYPFLRTTQTEDNRSDLIQYTVKAGGTLWALPSGDLTVAGGLEYRSESLIFSNDPNSRVYNIASGNFNGPLISARRWVHSAYGELDIPLLGDQWSWPGLRSLQVVLSERYDDYSKFGSAAKPKVAVLYKPFNDLSFRATYSENFVVPTLGQLFGTPLQFQQTIFDPLKSASYNVLLQTNGNPDLKPQSAYGYYLEAVWTPASQDENSWWHWAKGFTAYIDWYQISVRGVIGFPNPQSLVPANQPGVIIRNAAGFIQQINSTYQNLGNLLTDGLEFGASYVTKEYNWGKLEFDWNGAYIYKMDLTQLEVEANGFTQFILTDLTDIMGGIPVGSGPDFKFVGSLFYSKHVFGNDLFRTGFTVNYVGSELDQTNDAHGTIPPSSAPLSPPGYVHLLGSWTTWDWQISYEFGPPVEVTPETPKPGYDKEGKRLVGEKAIAPPAEGHGWSWRRLLDNTTFTFGIKNIFDTPPPLQVATGGPFFQGYDTQVASPVQRFFYGQIEKKF